MNSISYAAFLAMFAYGGLGTSVKLMEEAKNPKEDIPMALMSATITSMIIYILISLVIVKVLNIKNIGESSMPLADVAKIIFGDKMQYLYGLIGFISVSSAILITILGKSRLLHGISHHYPLLNKLGYINETTKTPIIAILAIAFASIIALLIKNVEQAAAIVNYLYFGILALVNLSLTLLHFDGKYKTEFANTMFGELNKHFPITPILAFITSIGMIIFSFLYKP